MWAIGNCWVPGERIWKRGRRGCRVVKGFVLAVQGTSLTDWLPPCTLQCKAAAVKRMCGSGTSAHQHTLPFPKISCPAITLL